MVLKNLLTIDNLNIKNQFWLLFKKFVWKIVLILWNFALKTFQDIKIFLQNLTMNWISSDSLWNCTIVITLIWLDDHKSILLMGIFHIRLSIFFLKKVLLNVFLCVMKDDHSWKTICHTGGTWKVCVRCVFSCVW